MALPVSSSAVSLEVLTGTREPHPRSTFAGPLSDSPGPSSFASPGDFSFEMSRSRSVDAYPSAGDREDSPLLGDNDSDDGFKSSPSRRRGPTAEVTPLPRAQLAAIYAIKLIVPVANTQIMPYVNKMIAGFDLPDQRNVGYYTGLLSFSHTAGQFMTIYAWGRLSDWIGRTRVIGVGMTGLALSTLFFGASRNFATALIFRFFTGVFSGHIGVIHSVVGELSDKTNQSTAFPFYDIISALGFVIGPIIGGAFEEPATELGGWFNSAFFRKYPYVLPCFIASTLAIFSALLSVFYLRETHPHRISKTVLAGEPAVGPLAFEPGEEAAPILEIDVEKPPSLRSLLALPVLRALCASQWMLGFIAAAFNLVFVLMAYTPIEDGGLSMNPRKIATALSVMGLVSMGLKAILPIFLRRFDALTVFRFTLLTWPVTFGLMPLLNIIARRGGEARDAGTEALLWVAVSAVLFMSRLGSLAFSIVMILTKDHTPSSLALGTTNSLSELFQMFGIAVGAPFISSLFAFSISISALGGHLWVVIICVLSLVGDYSASRMAKHRYA